jgi:hypothetical protein
MCFATAAAIAGVAGAATSATGAITGGVANAANSSYQAAVASNNAITAGNNANYALEAGEAKTANQSRKGAAASGTLKATQAANGVNVNSGTAVDVQTGERETNQLDTETTLNNSELQAYGYRTAQTGFEAESQLDEAKASQAIPAAVLGATGGLLSSASSLGGKWGGTGSIPNIPGFNPIAGVTGQ